MKEEYNVLKDKYGLPEFDALNKDFEIYNISNEDDVLREVLKKLLGVVDVYIGFLEDLIQPDSRYYTLKEANFLGKNDRVIVNKTYDKLMYINRKGFELNLNYVEGDAANFINKIFEDWQIIKKDLLPVVSLLKESWSKKVEIKSDGGYFG